MTRIFGHEREKVTDEVLFKSRKMRWALRVARGGNVTDLFKVLAKDQQGKQPFAKYAFK